MAQYHVAVVLDTGAATAMRLTDAESVAKRLLTRFADAGLETARVSGDDDRSVILVRLPDAEAARVAEAYGATAPIDAAALQRRAAASGTYFCGDASLGKTRGERGSCRRLLGSIFGFGGGGKGARNPYAFLHAPYKAALAPLLASDALEDPLRVALAWRAAGAAAAVDEDESAPWAGLPSLVARGDAVAAFPLHDEGRRAALAVLAKDGVHTVWSRSYGRFAERDLARYFGSSVAFYFCWLSHYASWLRYLAAAGLALVGVVACAPAGAVVAFARLGAAAFMAVWCALLCRSWHAREGRLALRWGTLAAAKLRGVRPRATRAAFRGAAGALDPVTGRADRPYFPASVRARRRFVSRIRLAFDVLIALLNVVFWKAVHVRLRSAGLPGIIATVGNAVAVFFLNARAMDTATRRADAENHALDADYDSAIFEYVLAFRVINSYAQIFYVAFVQRALEGGCGHRDCFAAVGHTAVVFFAVQLTLGNFLELGPATRAAAAAAAAAPSGDAAATAARQYGLAESPDVDTLDDYLELTIQFGYCVLFFVAAPVAPFLALLSNVLEAKVDLLKRVAKRRPVPTLDATTIQSYTSACLALGAAAVLTNAALLLYVAPGGRDVLNSQPRAVAIVLASMVAVARFAYAGRGKLPGDVELQLQRNEYVLSADAKLLSPVERAAPGRGEP